MLHYMGRCTTTTTTTTISTNQANDEEINGLFVVSVYNLPANLVHISEWIPCVIVKISLLIRYKS